MSKKSLPPGWSYEGPDPSVGIFGEEFVHEDCPTLAGPGYEMIGVTQTEHSLSCNDCGKVVAYSDPEFGVAETEPVVEETTVVKVKVKYVKPTTFAKSMAVIRLLVIAFFVSSAVVDVKKGNWIFLVIDVACAAWIVWVTNRDWPWNQVENEDDEDNDKSSKLRDTWKHKFHDH